MLYLNAALWYPAGVSIQVTPAQAAVVERDPTAPNYHTVRHDQAFLQQHPAAEVTIVATRA